MAALRLRLGLLTLLFGLAAPAAAADAPAADEAAPWQERTLAGARSLEALAADLAADPDRGLARLVRRGRTLFEAKFTLHDGAGRPYATQAILPTPRKRPAAQAFQRTGGPDASACAGCHNDPVVGGAGEFATNVFVSEGFESADFDSLDPQFSNERGSTALQGAGLIELLAREMTADLSGQRRAALRAARAGGSEVRAALESKGVSFGSITARPDGTVDFSRLEGVDPDLVVKPFSQKGVFVSLRQFTVNALNVHHGIQPEERFGMRWTGTADFDRDGKPDEIGAGDVSALVAFQALLPPPGRRSDIGPEWQRLAAAGEAQFGALGCARCHRPFLPLESTVFEDPGPLDTAGTLRKGEARAGLRYDLARLPQVAALPRDAQGRVLVPLFGDLKRHTISDAGTDRLGNELLGQRFVERDVFLTAELWGVGSTAPYGHRGDITTLDEVIRAHGGEAEKEREAYEALAARDREAVIAFLKTLSIPKPQVPD